ncbi:MAG: cysteine desulfurase [Chloroflexi bacterium]|nr:cysteine desulfurase [Chloroflexota bacterium]
MPDRFIYLDHSATTPVDERVIAAMTPYFAEVYGNPASVHRFGRSAEKALENSREMIAKVLNCRPHEMVFTSGGSEGDNLALRGVAYAAKKQGKGTHLITSPLEHNAVGRTMQQLEDVFGLPTTFLQPDHTGNITPEMLRAAMRDDTVLVSLMLANNEIGTILPVAELARVAHEKGAYFHTDAVQAAGQLDLDVQKLGVDLLSISAHKFYGPKGVGALYVRDGTPLMPAQTGGSHEEGRRSGTHNVPLIVGMATALEIAYAEHDQWIPQFIALRDHLIDGVLTTIPDVELTGDRRNRLPSHASFVFKHVHGNTLLMHLDMKGIAASSGSACKTGNPEPSEVLLALGYDREWAMGGLRLTVGRRTTHADIDDVLEVLPKVIEGVRRFSLASA